MDASRLEIVPAHRDDTRDRVFFDITADLFSPGFCALASALLSRFDGRARPASAPADMILLPVRRPR